MVEVLTKLKNKTSFFQVIDSCYPTSSKFVLFHNPIILKIHLFFELSYPANTLSTFTMIHSMISISKI